MNQLIRELSAEAAEILTNIRNCQELTYQQRNELMELVATDHAQKLALARNLMHDWTGIDTRRPRNTHKDER